MGTINVRSNLTGKVYPILISGNTPTASEDQFIRNYINQQDGGLIETPVEYTEEGSLIDVPKGIIGGGLKTLTQIPGGIVSLGESVGQKLGFDVASKGVEPFGGVKVLKDILRVNRADGGIMDLGGME